MLLGGWGFLVLRGCWFFCFVLFSCLFFLVGLWFLIRLINSLEGLES